MGRVYIYVYYSHSSDAPRSPSLARHPLCAGHREGLLCGKGVEPPRGRGRPSGARELQVFWGILQYNKNIFKYPFGRPYYYYYYYFYRASLYSKDMTYDIYMLTSPGWGCVEKNKNKLYHHPGGDINHAPTTDGSLYTSYLVHVHLN